ncbi:MAG: DUF4973 domain-containing protein [Bacteroidaceae bacterium]|nr:DUF4973 domain-containing protein [Bacteroidaceae bacterium]
MRTKIFNLLLLSGVALLGGILTACNDEWKDEQYAHYISFKAPLNDNGVTAVYVPYTRHNDDGTVAVGTGKSYYDLPVLVSGTTSNDRDITVKIGLSDTLTDLNFERFGSPSYRSDITDLYYKDMQSFATFPSTVQIKSGEDKTLLRVSFDFNGIDMVDKWVLPLEIKKDAGYEPHPRKNYAKAMLRVYPYNDYSGNYSATTLVVANKGDETNATGMETARGYVVDESTIFFYAGTVDESRTDRRNYKIYFKFIPDDSTGEKGRVQITSDNAANNGFVNNGNAAYRIYEQMDEVQPFLKHRYVIISGIDYEYTDEPVAGVKMPYVVRGILTLERQLNIQIPNEDQAIQW